MQLAVIVCFQVVLAFIYTNLVEWLWHKYVFHGMGKKKGGKFSHHWKKHHRTVRKSRGLDLGYNNKIGTFPDPTLEIVYIIVGALLHLPIAYFFPVFVLGVWIHGAAYYYIHRKSHLDVQWAKKWAPWHYDHHMGRNQDANWCVTFPFWDYIFNSRVYYLGTDDYTIDENRRNRRRSK